MKKFEECVMKTFSFDEFGADVEVKFNNIANGIPSFEITLLGAIQVVSGFEILKLAKKVKKFLRKQGLLDDSSK